MCWGESFKERRERDGEIDVFDSHTANRLGVCSEWSNTDEPATLPGRTLRERESSSHLYCSLCTETGKLTHHATSVGERGRQGTGIRRGKKSEWERATQST